MAGRKVNRTQLAEVFGVSMPTVDGWVRAGCPVLQRGSRGVEWAFDTAAVAKWREDRAVTDATGDTQQDEAEIDRRTKRAKMLQAELELAKARGEVAPVREAERLWAAKMAIIRQNILNVPQRAVLQLLGCHDETEFKTKLKKELALALDTASTAEVELVDEATEDDEA